LIVLLRVKEIYTLYLIIFEDCIEHKTQSPIYQTRKSLYTQSSPEILCLRSSSSLVLELRVEFVPMANCWDMIAYFIKIRIGSTGKTPSYQAEEACISILLTVPIKSVSPKHRSNTPNSKSRTFGAIPEVVAEGNAEAYASTALAISTCESDDFLCCTMLQPNSRLHDTSNNGSK